MLRTLSKWSFPPDVRVQMRKCLVNRKHCRSPSFLSVREPRRTLLSTPRSLLDGSWMREPGRRRGRERGQKEEAGRRGDERKEERTDAWVTLSDEGLTGVQQDVTALHDHPLDGQVLADVLRVAHLVVHHPGKHHPPSLTQTHTYIHTNTACGMCPNSL